jgi:single-strand DNA-binding protein
MLNMAQLIGHLGRDPDVRYSPEGSAVAHLAVATNQTWKDKDGERQERTEWHRVVLFGKLAETAAQFLKKGALVYLQGRLQTRKWAGEDGQDRFTTEIVAERLRMLGAKNTRDGQADDGKPGAAETVYDDDIPF